MTKTAGQLTAEEMRRYAAAAQKREKERSIELEKRRERALSLAKTAARILREKYRAQRVVLFGSLTDPETFTRWSDVDIAAWGLTAENSLRAMSDVAGLDPDIEVNLVDVQTVKPSLLGHIQIHGQDL